MKTSGKPFLFYRRKPSKQYKSSDEAQSTDESDQQPSPTTKVSNASKDEGIRSSKTDARSSTHVAGGRSGKSILQWRPWKKSVESTENHQTPLRKPDTKSKINDQAMPKRAEKKGSGPPVAHSITVGSRESVDDKPAADKPTPRPRKKAPHPHPRKSSGKKGKQSATQVDVTSSDTASNEDEEMGVVDEPKPWEYKTVGGLESNELDDTPDMLNEMTSNQSTSEETSSLASTGTTASSDDSTEVANPDFKVDLKSQNRNQPAKFKQEHEENGQTNNYPSSTATHIPLADSAAETGAEPGNVEMSDLALYNHASKTLLGSQAGISHDKIYQPPDQTPISGGFGNDKLPGSSKHYQKENNRESTEPFPFNRDHTAYVKAYGKFPFNRTPNTSRYSHSLEEGQIFEEPPPAPTTYRKVQLIGKFQQTEEDVTSTSQQTSGEDIQPHPAHRHKKRKKRHKSHFRSKAHRRMSNDSRRDAPIGVFLPPQVTDSIIEQQHGFFMLWAIWLLGLDEFDTLVRYVWRFVFRLLSLWFVSTFVACLKQQLYIQYAYYHESQAD